MFTIKILQKVQILTHLTHFDIFRALAISKPLQIGFSNANAKSENSDTSGHLGWAICVLLSNFSQI